MDKNGHIMIIGDHNSCNKIWLSIKEATSPIPHTFDSAPDDKIKKKKKIYRIYIYNNYEMPSSRNLEQSKGVSDEQGLRSHARTRGSHRDFRLRIRPDCQGTCKELSLGSRLLA